MNRLFSLSIGLITIFLLLTSTYQKASATIVAEPENYDFGEVTIGNSVPTTIAVYNSSFTQTSITVVTTNSDFSITSPTSFTLPPESSVDVNITYTPSVQGEVEAFLVIDDSLGFSLEVPLIGFGHSLGANPSSHDFGDVEVGSLSTIIITLQNQNSSNTININDVMTNQTSGDFSITSLPTNTVLFPSGTSELEITYTPSALGEELAALLITYDLSLRPLVVPLSGTGVPAEPGSPELTCIGFAPPFDDALYINKKAKGAIPVKFQLTDIDGYLVTDQDITAPPVINVIFNGVVYGDGSTDDEALEPVGKSNEGNEASYNYETGSWEYRLGTKQFSAPGTYSVIVRSGNMNEYTIVTTGGQCNQTFTRQL